MIEQSAEIGELAKALAIAQGKITGALKDSKNPFFKSNYADLASVWDACRTPLSENGIAVIQQTGADDSRVFVITTLAHSSGQWMRSTLPLVPKEMTPQGIGSAITYGRRYALAAAVGVAQIDDDGNAASGRQGGEQHLQPQQTGWTAQDTKKANEFAKKVIQYVDEGRDVMEIWDEITPAGEEFTRAVWCGLPQPIKTLIKDENDKRNKAKAKAAA